MAKTFLTNNVEYHNIVKKTSVDSGFIKYNEMSSQSINVLVFNKLKIDNENFIQIGKNFVSVSGTFIYDGLINNIGLHKLYDDFNHDINLTRKLLIGNYLITIKKDGILYILGDENSIYNINYYYDENHWIISNNIFDIANQIKERITVNELNLLEEVFQNTIINNETIFNNIMKLMGTEYIRINLIDNDFTIENYMTKVPIKRDVNYLEKLDNLVSIIQNNVTAISNNFKKITISMTGGLDSRIVLSSYLNAKVKPNIIYGIGNSTITNTDNQDLRINEIYKNEFTLNFTKMNWNTPTIIDKDWEHYYKKYGIYSRVYGGSNNVFESLENLTNTDFVDFGYFGETLRNLDWPENTNTYFSLNEYLDEFYIKKELQFTIDSKTYNKFRKKIYQKYLIICTENNLKYEKIHQDDFQILHNEYRKGADNAMLNLINSSFYSINLLSIKEIERQILTFTFKEKTNMRLIIELLNKLYPKSLSIPIYSHCTMYKLNKKTLLLQKTKKENMLYTLKNIVIKFVYNKKLFYLLKIIYRYLNNKLSKKKNSHTDMDLYKFCRNKLKNNSINFINSEKYIANVGVFLKYTQILEMLSIMKNRKE